MLPNFTILLVPSDSDFVFAQITAAARPFALYSNKKKKPDAQNIEIVAHFPHFQPTLQDVETIRNASFVVNSIRLAQRLVDAPPNELHTDAYIAEAETLAASLPSCTIKVIKGKQLEEEGFGGLWGVGKASEVYLIFFHIFIVD